MTPYDRYIHVWEAAQAAHGHSRTGQATIALLRAQQSAYLAALQSPEVTALVKALEEIAAPKEGSGDAHANHCHAQRRMARKALARWKEGA